MFAAIILCIVSLQLTFEFTSCEENVTFEAPQVTLPNGGVISGYVEFSRSNRAFNGFRGIPYATVPERFQEAKPITTPPWEGVLNGTLITPPCPQVGIRCSENCLSLNVFVPRLHNNETNGPDVSLPVMVWIHGGSFMLGAGFQYRPHYFMSEDVILITLNYRLGVFGFLSTGDNIIPGNAGLKDIVIALKWIQENIKQFGGDPSKVTIFGSDSGGAAVHYLMLSPTSQGLFQRAISQSGSALNTWAYQPHPNLYAFMMATLMNCSSETGNVTLITSAEILKCLKEAPLKRLIQAQHRIVSPVNIVHAVSFVPTVEPSEPISSLSPFISESPFALLAKQDIKLPEIPWIIGVTQDESSSQAAGIILSDTKSIKVLDEGWKNAVPTILDYARFTSKDDQQKVNTKVREFYFADKNITQETKAAVRNVVSDARYLYGVIKSAKIAASRGATNPVYLYQYAYKGSRSDTALVSKIKGEDLAKVGHYDEIQQQFFVSKKLTKKPEEEDFSKEFVRLWTSFAIDGKPVHSWGKDADTKWAPIQHEGEDGNLKWYRIQADPAFVDMDGEMKDRVNFWDGLWNDTILPAMSSTKAKAR